MFAVALPDNWRRTLIRKLCFAVPLTVPLVYTVVSDPFSINAVDSAHQVQMAAYFMGFLVAVVVMTVMRIGNNFGGFPPMFFAVIGIVLSVGVYVWAFLTLLLSQRDGAYIAEHLVSVITILVYGIVRNIKMYWQTRSSTDSIWIRVSAVFFVPLLLALIVYVSVPFGVNFVALCFMFELFTTAVATIFEGTKITLKLSKS